LSAIVPALQRLGHDVMPLPTILLSNHPGHGRAAGTRIEVNTLASIVDMLDANGWLADLDAVMTGYLPTPEHAAFAARIIDLVRTLTPNALVVVDPVLGDDPRGLYVDAAVARTLARDLVSRAGLITPNRFELEFLSGRNVSSVPSAIDAATILGRAHVICTSVPAGQGTVANVSVTPEARLVCPVPARATAPNGTGDLFSALIVGHVLHGATATAALGAAAAGVAAVIARSTAAFDLDLAVATGAQDWTAAPPLPVVNAELA
jgi:pyridoxine kinase